jgi:hypothetical protein
MPVADGSAPRVLGLAPHLQRVLEPAVDRVAGWLIAVTGSGLILLAVVNVTLAQGLGTRCDACFLAVTSYTLATFMKAGPPGDFAQDILGARRMLEGRETYPVLQDALPEIGLRGMAAPNRSTHPPTAYLFGLPFVDRPWPDAARLWALLMLAALITSWRADGLGWSAALALTAWGMLWPPLAASVGQLIPIWLLGQVLGWRWRGTPWLAGAALGVAALTKYLPMLLLIPFVLRGRWTALAGFTGVWGVAMGSILWLAPGTVAEYLRIAAPTAAEQAARPDNGALFEFAAIRVGPPAPVLAGLMVAAVLVRAASSTLATSEPDRRTWSLWAWLAVALLPVAWQVSLVPLATELIMVMGGGQLLPRLLAGAAIAAPMVLPWDGHLGRNGEGVFLCLVLTGMALAAHHGRAMPNRAEPTEHLPIAVESMS